MKVAQEVINSINASLAEEHAAYVQNTLHASICKAWGYHKLHEYFEKCAESAQECIEMLIDRIIFLGGNPMFAEVAPVIVGSSILELFPNKKEMDMSLISSYVELIDICTTYKDYGTKKIAEYILEKNESNLNGVECIVNQITQMGVDNYLAQQI